MRPYRQTGYSPAGGAGRCRLPRPGAKEAPQVYQMRIGICGVQVALPAT